ncbi:MAG: molybdenum cofactor guanylyltransferase [Actinobacteria bacterium]|nr:molybdenum cofactor guanylyltransferase [Actinomycetota bacterium]
MTGPPVVGAVLCGGASRRMGRDKAFVELEGLPFACRVDAALRAGGAERVVAVGGDADRLTAIGLAPVPDDHPGEGPLGGVLTALRFCGDALVVVAACDQPWLDGATVGRLIGALAGRADAAAAVPSIAGRRVPLPVVLRGDRAGPALRAGFAAGTRSLLDGLAELRAVEVPGLAPAALRDVDAPEHLRGPGERRPV